jgi:hypothetical protein
VGAVKIGMVRTVFPSTGNTRVSSTDSPSPHLALASVEETKAISFAVGILAWMFSGVLKPGRPVDVIYSMEG